jgi:6-phosphogluconolactonase
MFGGAAALVRGLVAAGVRERGCFTLVLSGGRTPERLYELLAAGASVPWDRVLVFWGDERFVPHDHPESNCGMSRRSLLSKVGIPEENVFPVPTGAGTPEQAAAVYEQTIRGETRIRRDGDSPSAPPSFDLILLGMGKDGHTASLYPGGAAPDEKSRLVRAVEAPDTGRPHTGVQGAEAPGAHAFEPPSGRTFVRSRITMTLPLINNSLNALLLVTGEDKKETLRRVLTERPPGDTRQAHGERPGEPDAELPGEWHPPPPGEPHAAPSGEPHPPPPGAHHSGPQGEIHSEPLPAQLLCPRRTLYVFTDISIWQI